MNNSNRVQNFLTHCRQALQNIEVIINEWIDTAKSLNRPIPEPKGRLMFA